MKKSFKYIYGPVSSWRLGRSLGIDPISQKTKQCMFDCSYCQIGREKTVSMRRKIFVPTHNIVSEITQLSKNIKIDYITFSGSGEPTLAKNLGELIKEIKKIRKEPVAVITNSALLGKKDALKDIISADLIMAKFEAPTQSILVKVNNPHKTIVLSDIILNLKNLRSIYKKILALQIMFVEDNMHSAKAIAKIAAKLKADIVFINTPLRPSECRALSRAQMKKIENEFKSEGLKVISVFNGAKKRTSPISKLATLKRRGDYK